MRSALVAALALGCATAPEPTVFDGLPELEATHVHIAAPPGVGGARLRQVEVLQPGTYADLRVSGLSPGDQVLFLGSRRGRGQGPCSSSLAICADIRHPFSLGIVSADATGDASLSWLVPYSAADGPIWFQAAWRGASGATTTNVQRSDVVDVCPDVISDFFAEAAEIQSCVVDDECGQVLTGTSCGCTRNWIARMGADTTDFYDLMDEANANACSLPIISTCDCPPTNGIICNNGWCAWDYSSGHLP